jgi:hypothetical protein
MLRARGAHRISEALARLNSCTKAAAFLNMVPATFLGFRARSSASFSLRSAWGAGTERSAAHADCASTGLGWLPSWRQRYPGHTCVAQLSFHAREWVAAVCPLPHTQCANCIAGDAGCGWSVPGQKPRGAALTFICSVFLRRRRTFSGTTACPRTVSVLGLGDMALSAP